MPDKECQRTVLASLDFPEERLGEETGDSRSLVLLLSPKAKARVGETLRAQMERDLNAIIVNQKTIWPESVLCKEKQA